MSKCVCVCIRMRMCVQSTVDGRRVKAVQQKHETRRSRRRKERNEKKRTKKTGFRTIVRDRATSSSKLDVRHELTDCSLSVCCVCEHEFRVAF